MNDAQVFGSNSYMYTPPLPETDIYPTSSIEQIERTFCTNFSCCNIVFPDLHALLDHYDVTTSGHSICPTPRTPPLTLAISPSPSSSPPSSPSSIDPEDCPLQPHYYPPWPTPARLLPSACADLNTASTVAPPYVYHPDAYALSEYPTYEHCYRAATLPVPIPDPFFADALAPLLHHSPPLSSSSSPSPASMGRPPLMSTDPLSAALCRKSGKRRGKLDLEGLPLASSRRRVKKAYHCPTRGCTKSYLNPNGLKYHQEKGTCKIEGLGVASNSIGHTPAGDPVPLGHMHFVQPRRLDALDQRWFGDAGGMRGGAGEGGGDALLGFV
ncbi:hypothetical protein FPV67DRAFT_930025 [Lyophyllum atratum]|nr:hypothetical protein FPV67DRAFT_930025 [Lyophyllum atratum]